MSSKDFVFYLNWEDREKNAFKVGFIAQIEKEFYLLIKSDEKDREDERSAYDRGFIGIPGFRPGEIYKSSRLFDFFRNRILDKDSQDLRSELSKNNGSRSSIDSFYLELVSEISEDKQKERLLEAYKTQEELKRIRSKSKSEIGIGDA